MEGVLLSQVASGEESAAIVMTLLMSTTSAWDSGRLKLLPLSTKPRIVDPQILTGRSLFNDEDLALKELMSSYTSFFEVDMLERVKFTP